VRFTIRRFAYFSSSHNTQISNLAPSFCSQPCTHKLSHNQTLTRTILCLTHLCVLQKKYTYHPQTTCKIHQLSHITFCISVYSLSLVCFKNSKSISKWCTNTYINQIKECNENTIFKNLSLQSKYGTKHRYTINEYTEKMNKYEYCSFKNSSTHQIIFTFHLFKKVYPPPSKISF